MNKTFADIHLEKKGKASDKWESYLSYYEKIFSPLRKNNLSLLEIGIQNGGSLETYSEYFKNAKTIIGCDKKQKCSLLKYSDPKINLVIGDINTNETYQKILNISDSLDIIIDDGSHISSDIIISFLKYFPLLRKGGIYIIEDTHTLYTKQYGGGLFNQNSAINFFKLLIEVLNYEFWHNDITISNYLSTFFPKDLPKFIDEGWIESIEFRNSIITIIKSVNPGHKKLGKKIVTGSEMNVQKIEI